MALPVPIPIFGDHEIRLTCRLRFRNKESPFHHQMCRTRTILLPPFGITPLKYSLEVPLGSTPGSTPWKYPLQVPFLGSFLWGFSVDLFGLICNIFRGGVMPQSNMTWMYVARAYHGMWLWISRHNYCISLT